MQLGLQLVNSANLKKRFLATVAVWPNGEGIGFRSRGLQVRVLSRSITFLALTGALLLLLCATTYPTLHWALPNEIFELLGL